MHLFCITSVYVRVKYFIHIIHCVLLLGTRDEYRERESGFAHRLHTLQSGLISECEIKVKAQRGGFRSDTPKNGSRA